MIPARRCPFWINLVCLVFVMAMVACGSGGSKSSSGGLISGTGGGSNSGGTGTGTGSGSGTGTSGGSGSSSATTFLYAAQDGGSQIQSAAVDANGTLTAGSTADTGAQDRIVSFAATSDGRYLYTTGVAGFGGGVQLGNNALAMFSVNQQTGQLTPLAGSPMIFPDRVGAILVPSNASNAYVVENGQWTSLTLDPATGVLTRQTTGGQAGLVAQAALSTDGHFLVSAQNGNVYVDAASGTQVTNVAGSPFALAPAGSNITALNVASNGLLFVASQPSTENATTTVAGSLAVYSINSSGSPVALGTSVATGQFPFSISITPDSHYLYLTTQAFGGAFQYVEGYAIGTNGALTPVPGSPYTATGPQALSIDPAGKYLFVTGDSGTSVYTINASTGALTLLSTSSIPSGVFSIVVP